MRSALCRSAGATFVLTVLLVVTGCALASDKAPETPQRVAAPPTSRPDAETLTTGGSITDLDIHVDDAGIVTASWQESDLETNDVPVLSSQRDSTTGVWSEPVSLKGWPVIASTGDAVVAWLDTTTSEPEIYVSTRIGAQGRWSNPVHVTDRSRDYRMAISDSGIVTLAWLDGRLLAAVRIDVRSGVRAGPFLLRLPSDPIDWGLAANARGDAIGWWTRCLQPTGRPCRLNETDERAIPRSILQTAFLQRDAETWAPVETVTRHRPRWTRNIFHPSVGLDDAGAAHAIWVQEAGSSRTRLLAADQVVGVWGPPQRLSAPGIHFDPLSTTSVALLGLDSSGDSAAAWLAENALAVALRSAADGAWHAQLPLIDERCSPCSDGTIVGVDLAVAGGRALVAWGEAVREDPLSGPISVRLLQISNGSVLLDEELPAATLLYGPGDGNVDVAVNDAGTAVVAWFESDDGEPDWDLLRVAISPPDTARS